MGFWGRFGRGGLGLSVSEVALVAMEEARGKTQLRVIGQASSWRGWRPTDFRVEFCGDQLAHMQHRDRPADLGLEIPAVESHKHVQAQHREQDEDQYRRGVVPEDVVRMPAIDQLVEPLILDAPALMAHVHDRLGRGLQC